jgi:DNA-binding LacI/PurR family transcriptional regulator
MTTTETPRPAVNDSKRLALVLRRAIQEGQYAANDPFPSIRELARKYGSGLRVARTATDILVREGLLLRRERIGAFVRPFLPRPDLPDNGSGLRCVTILERPAGVLPAFVRMDYLQGHTRALDAYPIRMRAMNLPDSLARLESALSDQYPLSEQGCILINIVEAPVFEWLRERGVSFVVQNYTAYPKEALPPHSSVAVNKVDGAFQATRRLIELGHRRIGYAGIPQEEGALNEVFQGYQAALHCAGLEARKGDLLIFKTDDPAQAHLLALPLMKGRNLPTAIVGQTDSVALGVLRAARTLGIRVPEDLSVTGFNDQTEAARSVPPLTTVAVPRVQLGRVAVEILLAGSAGKPVTRVLECHLVERGSAGRVDGGG